MLHKTIAEPADPYLTAAGLSLGTQVYTVNLEMCANPVSLDEILDESKGASLKFDERSLNIPSLASVLGKVSLLEAVLRKHTPDQDAINREVRDFTSRSFPKLYNLESRGKDSAAKKNHRRRVANRQDEERKDMVRHHVVSKEAISNLYPYIEKHAEMFSALGFSELRYDSLLKFLFNMGFNLVMGESNSVIREGDPGTDYDIYPTSYDDGKLDLVAKLNIMGFLLLQEEIEGNIYDYTQGLQPDWNKYYLVFNGSALKDSMSHDVFAILESALGLGWEKMKYMEIVSQDQFESRFRAVSTKETFIAQLQQLEKGIPEGRFDGIIKDRLSRPRSSGPIDSDEFKQQLLKGIAEAKITVLQHFESLTKVMLVPRPDKLPVRPETTALAIQVFNAARVLHKKRYECSVSPIPGMYTTPRMIQSTGKGEAATSAMKSLGIKSPGVHSSPEKRKIIGPRTPTKHVPFVEQMVDSIEQVVKNFVDNFKTPKDSKAKKKKPSATLEDVAKKKILQTITRARDTGCFQEAEDYFCRALTTRIYPQIYSGFQAVHGSACDSKWDAFITGLSAEVTEVLGRDIVLSDSLQGETEGRKAPPLSRQLWMSFDKKA